MEGANSFSVDAERLLGVDVHEGAAIALVAMMAGLSEENWCASWLDGLEYSLWRAALDEADRPFGKSKITARQCRLLKALSDECQGWWVWNDGPKFVDIEDWVAHVATLGDSA